MKSCLCGVAVEPGSRLVFLRIVKFGFTLQGLKTEAFSAWSDRPRLATSHSTWITTVPLSKPFTLFRGSTSVLPTLAHRWRDL